MKTADKLRRLYSTEQVLNLPLYSALEASRYLQVPENTLRSWTSGRTYPVRGGHKRSNVIIELPDSPQALLSFVNLTEAHVLDALRRQYGVALPKIRRAVEYMKDKFDSPHPLVSHEMLTDGKSVFIEGARVRDEIVNASRYGQLAMKDLVELHLQRIEWDKSGVVLRLYPFTTKTRTADQPKLVTMDPHVEFGKPVLSTSHVPAAVIADRFKAGESIDEIADDYGETPQNIQEAIRCELQLPKAA
ncbi:MAG: DUF433 domain-containing protein [Acidobacteria bacterium]|nr:DUF433 domain-containing protein [Acidobacteriota bacterium]